MMLRNEICGMTYKTPNAELSEKYKFTNNNKDNNNDIRLQTKIRKKY